MQLVQAFSKSISTNAGSLRGTKILFCERGTNSKTTHYLQSYFFQLNILKGSQKASTVNLLRMNALRGTKTAFLTPKGYDKHLPPFYVGVIPRNYFLFLINQKQN